MSKNSSNNGKGSKSRITNKAAFDAGWDRIFKKLSQKPTNNETNKREDELKNGESNGQISNNCNYDGSFMNIDKIK